MGDLAQIPLERLHRIEIPDGREDPQTVSRRLVEFQSDVQRFQVNAPAGDQTLEVFHEGSWNSERFTLRFWTNFHNRDERDRVAETIAENMRRRGLPSCWLNQSMIWEEASASRRELEFRLPNVPIAPGIALPGPSACEGVRDLYPN